MAGGKVISVGESQGENPPAHLMIEDNETGDAYYSDNYTVKRGVSVTNYCNAPVDFTPGSGTYQGYTMTASCTVLENGSGDC